MRCPKCGSENPDDSQLCSSCSWVLTSTSTVAVRPDAKTSGLAIASLVLAILSFLTLFITAIPAIILGIVGLVKIEKSAGRLKGKGFAAAGITITVIACLTVVPTIFFLWCLDAPPIPNDYTIADFRSAPSEYAKSFELLKSLTTKNNNTVERLPTSDAPAIGLSTKDIDLLENIFETIMATEISGIPNAYAIDIEQAWAKAEKARDIIDQLNTFTEIADLTEPGVGAEVMFERNFIHLARLYQAYALLQTEQGKIQTITIELIKLDSVFRKLSLNVRPLVAKLVCLLCIEVDIVTANSITNNPGASQESIELLAGHFSPLTKEQTSLRNGVMFEYLLAKDFLTEESDQSATVSTLLFIRNSILWLYRKFYPPPEGVVTEEFEYRVMRNTPLFKRNSTLRLYRNFWDGLLNALEESGGATSARLSVWPTICPFRQTVSFQNRQPLPLVYRCYNPVGSWFIQMLRVPTRALSRGISTTEVRDDLLQIVLNKRLGKEVSLKTSIYSDEYILDVENKQILSPGPDGEIGTKDDIKLMINPEVLGWQN